MRVFGVVALAGGIAVAACSPSGGSGINPSNPEQIVRGEAVYREYCAVCHGANREGQPDWRRRLPSGRLPAPPHDETGHTWHHPDDLLIAIVRDGMRPPWAPDGYESDMPAFGDVLSDDDIRAVLAYIQSTWPEEVREMRRQRLEQAAR